MTPSSITKPRSSSQQVYWALPGWQARMSRARTPPRKASTSLPVMRYLKSGLVSEMPAALRTAKYSNLSDIWERSAARWPLQWLQSCVSLRALVRSWNGGVRIKGLSLYLVPFGDATGPVIGRLRNIVLRCGRDRSPCSSQADVPRRSARGDRRGDDRGRAAQGIGAHARPGRGRGDGHLVGPDPSLLRVDGRCACLRIRDGRPAGPGDLGGVDGEASSAVEALRIFFRTYTPADKDWAFQLWLDAWAEAARRPAVQGTSRRLNLEWQGRPARA